MATFFDELSNFFSGETSIILTLLFFTTVIVIYSTFVYFFYRFLAKKNIFELNLSQYNQYAHPFMVKLFAVIFYILEYIVILPILTSFWFAVLSILVLSLAEGIGVGASLLISAALVSSVRVTSYISESLSRDLAKMLPFTLLAIALTKPTFFNITIFMARISEIPSLLGKIPYFLIFIVFVEFLMRIFEFTHMRISS